MLLMANTLDMIGLLIISEAKMILNSNNIHEYSSRNLNLYIKLKNL